MSETTLVPPYTTFLAIACMGALLGFMAAVNLSGRDQPLLQLNEKIVRQLADAGKLPPEAQMKALVDLREDQAAALKGMPAEPFAWARYSYLLLATEGDKKAALAALNMSNLVSPEEPRELPERAIMWHQLASVESDDEKSFQAVLWRKAFLLQPDRTWAIAKQNNLTDEVGAAIEAGDAEEYEEWKAHATSH